VVAQREPDHLAGELAVAQEAGGVVEAFAEEDVDVAVAGVGEQRGIGVSGVVQEVREVAETVREIGLTPWSAQGTAERQAWIADLADDGLFGAKGTKEFARSADWRTEADRILGKVKPDEKQ